MITHRLPLPAPAPGHQRELLVHQFGDGDHKAYLQAGLHADEWPGLLTLQLLMERLTQLEAEGKVLERIDIVPFANPVGMNQRIFGKTPGRFDFITGQNFNRGMAIDADDLIERVGNRLGADGATNDALVRTELRTMVAEKAGHYEIEALHRALLSQSLDATVMLDLHCDYEALPHLFYGDHQRDIGSRLAHCLGFPVRLEEDVRGVVAFDGTHTQPWVKLAEATHKPFARPCFAATLELRGQNDVNETLARRDCEGILAFLEAEGFVRDSGAKPQTQEGDSVTINVDQVKVITASHSGIAVFHREMGEHLNEGDHYADIVLLDSEGPERIAVTAPASGVLFSRTHQVLTHPGATLGMIASDKQQIKPGKQLSF